jgi:predicted membrane protein
MLGFSNTRYTVRLSQKGLSAVTSSSVTPSIVYRDKLQQIFWIVRAVPQLILLCYWSQTLVASDASRSIWGLWSLLCRLLWCVELSPCMLTKLWLYMVFMCKCNRMKCVWRKLTMRMSEYSGYLAIKQCILHSSLKRIGRYEREIIVTYNTLILHN